VSVRSRRPQLSRVARTSLFVLRVYVLATVPLALYALIKALF
jgi:hypothetical protein